MALDPIKRYGSFLVGRNLAAQADLDKIAADVKTAVAAALAQARTGPKPDPTSANKNVYATGSVPAVQFFGNPF